MSYLKMIILNIRTIKLSISKLQLEHKPEDETAKRKKNGQKLWRKKSE